MSIWQILALVFLILAMPAGLIAVVLGLPGTWIILVASTVYAWLTAFTAITMQLILALLILAAAAEIMDLIAAMWGARRYGGSKKAMLGTMLGGILGAIVMAPLFLGFGAVLGAFFGAFAGAFLVTYLEQRKMDEAVRVGWGAFLGRVFVVVFKGATVVSMIGLDLWAIFTHGA
jgi:uncharacterized protein YqgC (DUF456 family)